MKSHRPTRRPSHVLVALAAMSASTFAQGTTERISLDTGDVERPYNSLRASISADGNVVAFTAYDSYGNISVLIHDRTTGVTDYANADKSGLPKGTWSDAASISADGSCVVFWSDAHDLVAHDTNRCIDIFVHHRATGATRRVSVTSSGAEADGNSGYVYGGAPAISADGSVVSFTSYATNFIPDDINQDMDVFVHDSTTGLTECVSVSSLGGLGNYASGRYNGSSLSADGRFVAYDSFASNLVDDDRNGTSDIFVHDRSTRVTERVSVASGGGEASGWSWYPWISGNGRFVAFTSYADDLVRGDTNGVPDVFVHDRVTGITERVSVSSSGEQANAACDTDGTGAISADGRFVVFNSMATNLASDCNYLFHRTYVHDRSTGRTECVSVNSAGDPANQGTYGGSVSGDGSSVIYWSNATNLVGHDTNNQADVFLYSCCWTAASWTNYGVGFPGTNGVPSFTARANPVLGATLALDLGNSAGRYTVAALFVGVQRATLSSGWGGDLLVDPLVMTIVGVGPGGTTLLGDIPRDQGSCGATVDLQAIESDPGAAHGVSFTAGLELLLGN